MLNGGHINAKLQLDKYTITLTCIFIAQIAFCFGIFGYVNNKVKAAEMRNEKQKAWFYTFLYQYHKQMSDEEQYMAAIMTKGNTLETPGKMD